MKKENQKYLFTAIGLLAMFAVWTVSARLFDVKAIGPHNSNVGFATFNLLVHNLTGVNIFLYYITDWLSLVPFVFIVGFALLGFVQLINRKSILKVDYSVLVLGGFYIAILAIYLLFEVCIINYRPILVEGVLEASYPSSTTMLVMTVMLTSIMQFNTRIKHEFLRNSVTFLIAVFTLIMVVLRILSGVHWITDIIGGILISSCLVSIYSYICSLWKQKQEN